MVQEVVLSSLPYPESNRLVFLWQSRPGVPEIDVSEPNFEDWHRNSPSFDRMSALTFHNFNLSSSGSAEHLVGIRASATFLATLKVKPILGHDFTPEDDQPNGPPVVLVSYRLWKERFGGDPQAGGRTLVLNGKTFTIFGVLPPCFQFLADADVIIPLRPQMPAIYADRSVHALAVVARLSPGVGLGQAQSELNSVQQEVDRQYPDANRSMSVEIWPIKKMLIGDVRGTLPLAVRCCNRGVTDCMCECG